MLAAIVPALTLLLTGSLESDVAAMTPREKAGVLDEKLVRVLRYRRSLGAPAP